jgi:hypothetical protein
VSDSLDKIALRCFKLASKQKLERNRKRSTGEEEVGCSGCLVALLVLGAVFGMGPGALVLAGVVLLGRMGIRHVRGRTAESKAKAAAQAQVASKLRAFHSGDPDAVQEVYRFATVEFRRQIEAHRARTLGASSKWAKARAALDEASDGARRSRTYWRTRRHDEPDNSMVVGQLETARQLDRMLRSALSRLDRRAEVLLSFYNECEVRLATLDRHNQDIEETRRLDQLSGSANLVVANANITLAEIGASFIREARNVGEVLGGFERLQIKTLAGEAPLDDIEYLAERIIESSDSELDAVERLKSALTSVEHPSTRFGV